MDINMFLKLQRKLKEDREDLRAGSHAWWVEMRKQIDKHVSNSSERV